MRAIALLLALALSTAVPCWAKDPPLKKINEIDIPEGKYHLELPSKFKADAPTPVVVFLHGKTVDLKADNAKGQLNNEFVTPLKNQGYVVVCPVMPPDHRPHWWENGGSLEFVDAVMKDVRARVKVSYMIVSGFSAGANYSMILHQDAKHHHWFAGFLVMGGGGWINPKLPEVHKKKPVFLGCGDSDNDTYTDTLNTTGGARKTIEDLKAGGFDGEYEEFPKTGHTLTPAMAAAAVKWVARKTPMFQVYGSIDGAGRASTAEERADALRQFDAVGSADPGEYWKKKADEARAKLAEAVKKEIAVAEAQTDPAEAKKALAELARAYKGTSAEKDVKEAQQKAAGAGK